MPLFSVALCHGNYGSERDNTVSWLHCDGGRTPPHHLGTVLHHGGHCEWQDTSNWCTGTIARALSGGGGGQVESIAAVCRMVAYIPMGVCTVACWNVAASVCPSIAVGLPMDHFLYSFQEASSNRLVHCHCMG